MKKIILPSAAIGIIVLVLVFPEKAMDYARSSLSICFETIIPTLFPFFICSGILVYSGICEVFSSLFRFCMKPLFGINPAGAPAFVMGIISGFPLGAVTAGQLYENAYISKVEAERLCAFCNNSGPLFIMGSVGAGVYGSIRIGAMLYIIHILSALSVGMIFKYYKRGAFTAPNPRLRVQKHSGGEIISIAVNNAVNNMLVVCGSVVFFSMAGKLVIDLFPLDGALYALASGMAEFVNGIMGTAALDMETGKKLVMTAFIIGFGGLSVHAQAASVTARHGFSLIPYIVGMFLHGIIAALYTIIYLRFFPITEAVFAPALDKAFCASAACMASAAAFIMFTGVFALGIRLFSEGRKRS